MQQLQGVAGFIARSYGTAIVRHIIQEVTELGGVRVWPVLGPGEARGLGTRGHGILQPMNSPIFIGAIIKIRALNRSQLEVQSQIGLLAR